MVLSSNEMCTSVCMVFQHFIKVVFHIMFHTMLHIIMQGEN